MPIMNQGQWLVNGDLSILEQVDIFNTDMSKGAGRYHFYFSYGCPISHRLLLLWSMFDLKHAISASSVDSCVNSCGWEFSDAFPDPLYRKTLLLELYRATKPDYSGEIKLPLLWDKQRQSISCNQPEQLITAWASDYGPAILGSDLGVNNSAVTEYNEWLDENFCQKIKQISQASCQSHYQTLCLELFESLELIVKKLGANSFLQGEQLTLSDIYFFPCLIRFDLIYYPLFKTNLKSIAQYPNLVAYIFRILEIDGIKNTIDIEHIKQHYYQSTIYHQSNNLIPLGPDINYLFQFR
ncbi:MAG: glutathione S-transferase C-terminal domain-containing protein [Gammaproteobacteria bacterium]|nr:glutathione S-transferase C-terminal domain-containing protein [Gammaproteobacteria bacterium]